MNSYFVNRKEAGIKLASRLLDYKKENAVVLAIPRGGVPVAAEVAKELDLPLDIVLARKIGHPDNKEYAIGAASMNHFFITDREDVPENYVMEEFKSIRKTLNEMNEKFKIHRPEISINKKTVILIDDGVATGNTLLATVKLLKLEKPAGIIIAVPVATRNAINKLSKESDDVVVLIRPDSFPSVGSFYQEFEQVTDDEVMKLLDSFSKVGAKIS